MTSKEWELIHAEAGKKVEEMSRAIRKLEDAHNQPQEVDVSHFVGGRREEYEELRDRWQSIYMKASVGQLRK